jgi:transposase-like protein
MDVRVLYETDGMTAFRCHDCGNTFNVTSAVQSMARDEGPTVDANPKVKELARKRR